MDGSNDGSIVGANTGDSDGSRLGSESTTLKEQKKTIAIMTNAYRYL
jgi:hypothetical protein